MSDYAPTTWVDDDGSGTVGTVGTAARMNNLEAGVDDAAEHHKTGLDSAKPVATAANKNWRYYATDTGIEYQSNGVTWTPLYPLATSSLAATGNISAGTISSSGAGGGGGSGVFLDAAGLVAVDRATAAGNVFSGGVASDAQRRIAIDYTGKVTWGDGTTAGDTNLYRYVGGVLKTDSILTVGAITSGVDFSNVGFSASPGGYVQNIRALTTQAGYSIGVQNDTVTRLSILAGGSIEFGSGSAARDLAIFRDSAGRFKQEATVAADTGAVIRNKSGTGFSGWQYNDWNDNALAFVGVANNATSSLQYFRLNPGTLPLRLMFNSVTRYENNATGMAWWGATPIARPARPTTLTEVINLIANYGLSL